MLSYKDILNMYMEGKPLITQLYTGTFSCAWTLKVVLDCMDSILQRHLLSTLIFYITGKTLYS